MDLAQLGGLPQIEEKFEEKESVSCSDVDTQENGGRNIKVISGHKTSKTSGHSPTKDYRDGTPSHARDRGEATTPMLSGGGTSAKSGNASTPKTTESPALGGGDRSSVSKTSQLQKRMTLV